MLLGLPHQMSHAGSVEGSLKQEGEEKWNAYHRPGFTFGASSLESHFVLTEILVGRYRDDLKVEKLGIRKVE